ncbi:radical SAM family heme chaperone HemW [Thermanaeromonas sp. C210]|uniref:radical SAM family heme chaperone HemW n=1 Tax=Thermanaeromonas sp. C210 TaxID=2731925 RepID=UPI00155D2FC0|nr:radical SAM family heme chaperone HemW [Thermanaeromonas sp. C210]GFN22527.1 coproporphyrinogen III oxidase [Thermanaeromonas sp. C210]
MNLYIHLPFCLRKCNYCDFISFPAVPLPVTVRYLTALGREMEMVASVFRPGKAATVYFGGGTPTYLAADDLVGLMARVAAIFSIEELAEITVEANPGTLTPAKLQALRAAGVNRLSLGAQAFKDELLKTMGRVHGVREIYESFTWARQAGFANISLDLIYGLPGQDLDDWEETLERALELEPEHLSVYGLELAPDTPWGRSYSQGRLLLPDEHDVVAMYWTAREKIQEAGYEHYEISNFARPGFQCRHNLTYWENRPYLGVGAGASSYWGDRRWQNLTSLEAYCRAVEEGQLPAGEEEVLTPHRQRGDTLFLGLRLLRGVSLKEYRERFGEDLLEAYGRELECLSALGLVTVEAGFLRLTEKGLPLANEVFVAFV